MTHGRARSQNQVCQPAGQQSRTSVKVLPLSPDTTKFLLVPSS